MIVFTDSSSHSATDTDMLMPPHQRLAVVVLRVRVERILGAGVAVMLLWCVQRQRGLVPAWNEKPAFNWRLHSTLEIMKICWWRQVRREGWKRRDPLLTEEGKPIISGNPVWHNQWVYSYDWFTETSMHCYILNTEKVPNKKENPPPVCISVIVTALKRKPIDEGQQKQIQWWVKGYWNSGPNTLLVFSGWCRCTFPLCL